MKDLPPFSAIILDMDGLVLETEVTYCRAWQQALLKLGFNLSLDFFSSLTGLPFQRIEEKLQQACKGQLSLSKFRQLSSDYWYDDVKLQGIETKKGLHELLAVIERYSIPYCLATNSTEKNARYCLNVAGIADKFPVIIGSDHVKQAKPAPDIIQKAAAFLNCATLDCLVVEDSLIGIQAAVSAGAIPVLIKTELNKQPALYHYEDLALLADVITSLFQDGIE